MGNIALHEIPEKYKKEKRNEADLRDKWLHRVLLNSGWNPERVEYDRGPNDKIVFAELTGSQGRVDYALKIGKRVVACIELKAATKDIVNDECHRKQAVKYANSYYLSLNGVRDPVMAICTNGLYAYICDPALENAHDLQIAKKYDLQTREGLDDFIRILATIENKKNGALPVINTKRIIDDRPYASNTTDAFEKEVHWLVKKIIGKGYTAQESVAMVTQVLLLSAARDNGIIPNGTIKRHSEKKEWSKLAKELNRLFGDVFEENLTKEKANDIWEIYEPTSYFKVRLDILPAQYMGTVYEKLVRKYFKSNTSYYTPEDMIDTILDECKPNIEDSVLDPTCGSGAFLSKAVHYACSKKHEHQNILKFFNNIVGVDKDPIACKVAKVTLLCTFMRIVGEDYQRNGKSLPYPQIHHSDFFDWNDRKKFSLILGNPPWDNIDQLSKNRKEEFAEMYDVYNAKNDQLCYILEKGVETHLKNNGRFGFVIKLQSLQGDSYKAFAKFLDKKVEKIFDYGRDQKFGNYAQSAGVCGKTTATKWEYKRLLPEDMATPNGEWKLFEQVYDASQGAQSSCDSVYKNFAGKYPSHPSVKKHPINLSNGAPPHIFVEMAYIWKDDVPQKFMDWLSTNPKEKKKLLARGDVKRSGRHPFSWRRNNSDSLKGPLLITERNLTPGHERFPFFIDHERAFLPLGGQTCISSVQQNLDDLKLLASLMVSTHFIPLCRGSDLISRRAGGIFFNPNTVKARLKIPTFSAAHKEKLIAIIAKAIDEKRDVTEIEIKAIDSIFKKYLILGKQQDASYSYAEKLLSEYLQPDIAKDDAGEVEEAA